MKGYINRLYRRSVGMQFFLTPLFLLTTIIAVSQNKIIYKSGKEVILEDLQVDSLSRTVRYLDEDSMAIIVSFKAIEALQFDKNTTTIPTYSLEGATNDAIAPLIDQVPYFELRFAEQPSQLIVDFNPFSLFTGVAPYWYPNNGSVQLGFEYQFTEHLAINSSLRYGVSTNEVGAVKQGYSYFEKGEKVLYEFSFTPKFYIWGQTKRSLFFGLIWTHGLSSYEREDVYEIGEDPENPEFGASFRQETVLTSSKFNELGIGVGVMFNFSSRFGITIQSFAQRSNRISSAYRRIRVDPDTGEEVLRSSGIYYTDFQFVPNLQLNLNFRLVARD